MDLRNAVWHKSSRSNGNGGNCVEVADNLPEVVAVRDTKNRERAVLVFGRREWQSFVEAVKNDRL